MGSNNRSSQRATPVKNAGHIAAHGLRGQQYESEEDGYLQPAIECHSELLRPQQRIDEIDEQNSGDEKKNRTLMHGVPFSEQHRL